MLGYLKEHTKAIHSQVESVNLAKHIVNHSITLEAYKELLTSNYAIYKAIEQKLIAHKNLVCNDLKAYVNTDKSDSLEKDLLQFGNVQINSIDLSNILIESEAEVIGALYVVEGSMLGSLLIANNISKCQALKHLNYHNFFNRHDHKNMVAHWKGFCKIVGKKTFSVEQKRNAGTMAKQIFRLFDRH